MLCNCETKVVLEDRGSMDSYKRSIFYSITSVRMSDRDELVNFVRHAMIVADKDNDGRYRFASMQKVDRYWYVRTLRATMGAAVADCKRYYRPGYDSACEAVDLKTGRAASPDF